MIRVLLSLVLLSACASAPRLTTLEVDSESVHTRTYFLDDRVFGLPYRAGYYDSTYMFYLRDTQRTSGFWKSVSLVQSLDSASILSVHFYQHEDSLLQYQLNILRSTAQ